MNINIKEIIASKGFQAIEHSFVVAAYIGATGFLTTLLSEVGSDATIANFVVKHPSYALLFMLVNMGLSGIVKYLQLHKAEIIDQSSQIKS